MASTTHVPKCKDLQELPPLVELLTITMEECAEVQQECSKMMRFGTMTNKYHLSKEIADLLAMIDLLQAYQVIDLGNVEDHKRMKWDKLKIYSNLNV